MQGSSAQVDSRPASAVPKVYSYGAIRLGSVLGVPVSLHLLYLLALGVAIVVSWWSGSGYNVGWAVVMFGPVLLVTILIHEMGHCLASRQVGAEVHGILLWPLGGLAFLGQAKTPGKDLWVALAGPLTHIPQFAVWYSLSLISRRIVYGYTEPTLGIEDPNYHFWLAVASGAAQMQLWVMAFNLLLPAYPLDGGRIFADALLMARVPIRLTAQLTLALAVTITVGLFVYGCWRSSVILILVSVWMLLSSFDLGRAIHGGTLKSHPMFCYEDLPAPPPAAAAPQRGPQGDGAFLDPNAPRSAPV